MLISKLRMYDIVTMFDIKTNNVLLMLDRLSIKILKRNIEKNSKCKTLCIPELNINQKKQNIFPTQVPKQVVLPIMYSSSKRYHKMLCTFCVKHSFTYNVQIRTFKTKRSISIEGEKKETVVNKFKQWIGHGMNKDAPTVKVKDFKVLKFLMDSKIPQEEYKRIVSVFIEGYLAGVQRHVRPRGWSKLLSTIFLSTFLLVIIWFGGYSLLSGLRFSMNNFGFIPQRTNVTFDDVKGIQEAKQELSDIVQFLKNPTKFSALGAKLPKGVLLVGPPGTGKTLLARAVAGEAGVPFFQTAGPEFDEILVGRGARKMRDLFRAAKAVAPAVIFIDEIDSVGSARTASALHPYANQTVNQLLTEMDGFLQNEGVIVLGATNRRNDLDKALIRPGRFDVEILISAPDYTSRKEIFKLYLSKIPARNINIDHLAKCTVGFTGAEIENMVNQAALRAACNNTRYITMDDLEFARDKMLMGPEKKSLILDDEQCRATAYHEAGHVLVSYYTKDAQRLHKVTITPRGQSLGHTSYITYKDEYRRTKSQLLALMDSAMGGRVAEELVYGPDNVSTGVAQDLKSATRVAEDMVCTYGMSDKVGLRSRKTDSEQDMGPNTNDLIDSEVKRLLEESYKRAKLIIQTHTNELQNLAEALIKYKTLDANDIRNIINNTNQEPN